MSSLQDSPLMLNLNSPGATLELVGGKGASLARMAAAGLPVPSGFQITTNAYRRFVSENSLTGEILTAAGPAEADDLASLDRASEQIRSMIARGAVPGNIAALIRQWYAELGPDDLPVAVRSSATAEDLPGLSFAGQYETFLNVRGGDNVVLAVKRCWASLWTARALGYRARQGIRPEDVALAVVVQELIPADVSGILFTANPVTGARDEMMINAAWGLGEAIVSGQVTPDTIVINKQTGSIESQQIAFKQAMTVRLSEGTREEVVPEEKRNEAAVRPAQAAELIRLGAQIEQLYGQPMDIEWAMWDERIFIVQARPITALPEPATALEWNPPRAKGSYWRSSVIELLPDPLSPLFATLGLPLWDKATRRLAASFGFAGVYPECLLLTINDYAYYDCSFKFKARVLVDFPLLIPRGIRLLWRARTRWWDVARPSYTAVIDRWAALDLSRLPAMELLAGTRAIVEAASDYYVTIQSGILPAASVSELLFTKVFNGLIKRKSDPPALTFLLGFDSVPMQAEGSLYDLAMWARRTPALAEYLTHTAGSEIAVACQLPQAPVSDAESWAEFSHRFGEHLNRFGHAVYDLDFAKSVPADDPAALLDTLKYLLSGQARNPHERRAASVAAREQATESLLARLRGPRLRLFRRLLETAQRYAPLREDALADLGLGWPLLRRIFREAGRRLAAAGAVLGRDDVFWLKWDEIESAARSLDAGQAPENKASVVAARRALWERQRKMTPPVVLPIKGGGRFFGIDWTNWMPARTGQTDGRTIKGVGASPGRAAGVARVIHGPGEFNQMRPGDILVAKITTPAWTPLFALASAIVTDVGGPLSHSSIVAREYRIPAVLGTGVATERMHSGQRIAVDGDAGTVTMDSDTGS